MKTRTIEVNEGTYKLITEMQKWMVKFDEGNPDVDPTIKITPELVIIRCLSNPSYLIRCRPELGEQPKVKKSRTFQGGKK
jgi:hypothetical protein